MNGFSIPIPRNLQAWATLLMPIAYVIQNPMLVEYEQIASGPKAFHLAAILLFVVGAKGAPQRAISASLIYLTVLVLAALINYRVDLRMANAVGFLMVFLGASGTDHRGLVWARRGAAIAGWLILLKMTLQVPLIMLTAAENTEGRPLYPTLLAGGVNIEVSTLVLLMGWAYSKSRLVQWVLPTALYLITQTRTIFVVFLAAFISLPKSRSRKRTNRSLVGQMRNLLLGLGGVVILLMLVESGIVDFESHVARLTNSLGNEPGSQGRQLLYVVALNESDCYLPGCGVGAAAQIIANTPIAYFFEDNFHNVYLQQLIEVGVLGLLSYVVIFGVAFFRARNQIRDEGLAFAIFGTFLMGFLQFNGYELLTALLLGLGFSNESTKTVNHHLRQPA